MSDYDIREYRRGDETKIVAAFNGVFREVCGPSYVDRNLEFWNWEFEQNPYGHRITVGLTEGGEVAAHYGGVPQRFQTDYGDVTFVHIVDSFVGSEHRAGLKRPGLFVRTALPWFDLCLRQGDAVLYGYPVKAAERVGSRYLDYKFVRVVDYLCRPVDYDAVAPFDPAAAGLTVESVQAVPADVDELWQQIATQHSCWQRRDAAYFEWRYRFIPGGNDHYEFYTARRDGQLVGVFVLRPQLELIPGACGIADWLVPQAETEVVDAFCATASRRARETDRQRVLAVFPGHAPEAQALLERGFETVSSSEFLERRLTHRIYDSRLTSEWLADHWWYTLGDTDLI